MSRRLSRRLSRRVSGRRRAFALIVSVAIGLAIVVMPALTPAAQARVAARVGDPVPGSRRATRGQHVLLLSVDGLHETDLAYYVRTFPGSALARLVANGVDYTNATTTFPSDSFPGMVAQLTGGGPGTTGVYYDDTYNRALMPPGTFDCSAATPGTEVAWTEGADRSQNPITLDAGQHLAGTALAHLPTNSLAQTLADGPAITAAILKMTPTPQTLLDPAALPVAPTTCLPLYPHQFIRVNTVFEVASAHGLRTAWSDKHAAYEILDGPSGAGIDDLFTPEINSVADGAGDDWTTDNALTQEYDSVKVAAILNEINGFDHSGSKHVGTPAVFGMNFQSVSTAEKLPTSDGLAGGYRADGTPGPLLLRALQFVDRQVGAMRQQIARDGLTDRTTIILSAKHGQSPENPATLRRVDDGVVIDAMNAAWKATHAHAAPLVAFAVDDDGMLMWLSDRTPAALDFAANYLLHHDAPANRIGDAKGVFSTAVSASGLTSVATGAAADALFGAPADDTHAPDLVGIAQHGVVYTGGVKKIAEHGGDAAEDRDVALVVSGSGAPAARTVATHVDTTQIAPTILRLLGLEADDLQAVRVERTKALPLLAETEHER